MNTYSLSHLTDQALLRDLTTVVAHERTATVAVLAHIAEFDQRRLYLPAGHPSMYSYCVHELRLSEEAAFKRIHAARAARRFPAIFAAMSEGRLHLSAVIMLAPHLTPETADELLKAAAYKSKSEIELLLVGRCPRPDLPTRVEAIPAPSMQATLATNEAAPERAESPTEQHAPGRVEAENQQQASGSQSPLPRPKLAPLSPERYALQLTMGRSMHDKLRYAHELLSHQVASGDVAQVLERALDLLIAHLERQKFAATSRPRAGQQRETSGKRYIPSHLKRAVWERDAGRCTFVSEAGTRCPARERLEFDHAEEVARGGKATAENIRLRCRAHNQYGADQTFGTEFMNHKRQAAGRRSIEAGAV